MRSTGWLLFAAASSLLMLIANAGELTAYVLGPDDQIAIRAIGAEELTEKPFTIDSSGLVNLPMIGRIRAAGLTVAQFETTLMDRLKTFYFNPQVAVTVTEFHSQPVSVIGAVNTPGVQQLRGQKTLIELLSGAGGLRPDAGSRITLQRRIEHGPIPLPGARPDATGQFSVAEVNLRAVMDNSHPEQNILIKPDDVISVPRAEVIYVTGEVHKSGGFPLNERETISVLQAVSLAEGLLPTSSPASARILRAAKPGSDRAEIPVDLRSILSGKTSDVPLQPDDILFVPTSTPKKAGIRAIEAAIQLGTGIVIWRR